MDPAMYCAAARGDKQYFEDAEANRLQVSVTPEDDNILHVATRFKQKALVEWLIKLDRSLICLGNKKGDTPLHVAAKVGHSEIIKLLIIHSISSTVLKDTVNKAKDTVLHDAVRSGHHEVVNLLIEKEAGLALAVNDSGESPIFLAMDRGFCKIAESILEATPECSYQGRNGMNVLHTAIVRLSKRKTHAKFFGGFARLLTAYLSIIDKLIFAVPIFFVEYDYKKRQISNDGTAFLRKLIKQSPTLISEADGYGWTPLHYAAYYGIEEAVELLLETDCPVAYRSNNKGQSAVHISAKCRHIGVTRKLVLRCPGTIELLDNKRRTPLHAATSGGSPKTVNFLLGLLPEDLINKQDIHGNTPMLLAALKERFKILAILAVDSRVDKAATNNQGLTAVEILMSQAILRRDFKVLLGRLASKGLLRSCQAAAAKGQRRPTDGQGKTSGTGEPQPNSEETAREDERKDIPVDVKKKRKRKREKLLSLRKEFVNSYLIVATIVATVTFTAIFSVPSGGGTHDAHEGMSTSTKKSAYTVFVIADSSAFGLSALAMLGLLVDLSGPKQLLALDALLIQWATCGMVIAFTSASYVLLAESSGLAAAAVACGSIFLWGFYLMDLFWAHIVG